LCMPSKCPSPKEKGKNGKREGDQTEGNLKGKSSGGQKLKDERVGGRRRERD